VIVLVIDQDRVLTFKGKGQSPVAIDPVWSRNLAAPSCSRRIVKAEHLTQTLTSPNFCTRPHRGGRRLDQSVADTLMVAFQVIVRVEIANRATQRPLADEDHAIETPGLSGRIFPRTRSNLGIGAAI